jgi:hypothetical protein
MMSEILARGPVTCGVAAPDDFVFGYHSGRKGGVYVDNSGARALLLGRTCVCFGGAGCAVCSLFF